MTKVAMAKETGLEQQLDFGPLQNMINATEGLLDLNKKDATIWSMISMTFNTQSTYFSNDLELIY